VKRPNGSAAEPNPAAFGEAKPGSKAKGCWLQLRDGPRVRPQPAASPRRCPDAPTAQRQRYQRPTYREPPREELKSHPGASKWTTATAARGRQRGQRTAGSVAHRCSADTQMEVYLVWPRPSASSACYADLPSLLSMAFRSSSGTTDSYSACTCLGCETITSAIRLTNSKSLFAVAESSLISI